MKKAFDQTVRDLKREVNKKVLKVPSIEQKILDATSNEPWGPHGSLLADIAQATQNYHEYQMIMNVIWKRINDTGKNWRHVYKGLFVLDYLVAHGAERVIDDIKEHAYQISTLSDFQYIDSGGRDQGSNVRRKSQSLVSLVNDKERIQEARQKAHVTRDRYRSTLSTGGYRNTSGGYGGSYDNDRYEGSYGGRYEDRNGYGREREYGYRDDDRYGGAGDTPNRDGDRYSRDSNERYGRDNDRDGEYRGHGNYEYAEGSRRRSFSRERDRSYDDDESYSSRGRGSNVDGTSQDDRQMERKSSDQHLGAPPSYEAATRDAQSNLQEERNGGNVPVVAQKVSSPPAPSLSSPSGQVNGGQGNAADDVPAPPNAAPNGFDEFDPRGSVSAAPPAVNNLEMELFSSDPINSLALVSMTPTATTQDVDLSAGSGFETNNFAGMAPTTTVLSEPSYNNPFGDPPFKAITEETPSVQQTNVAPASSFQPVGSGGDVHSFPSSSDTSFTFGDALGDLTYAPDVTIGRQEVFPSTTSLAPEVPAMHATALPPKTVATTFAPSQVPQSAAPSLPTDQSNFLVHPASHANTDIPSTFPSQSGVTSSFPSQSGVPFPSQSGVPTYVPSQAGQYAPPVNLQASQSSFLPQSGLPGSVAPQAAPVAPVASQPSASPNTLPSSMNFPLQSASSAPLSSETTVSALQVAKTQPAKKFEPKSTVWADTLSRGLVNLNISGPKTNPHADIGIDFDSINRKEKREEKKSYTAPVVSTVNMGKAMGAGSGIGRASAGGVAPPPNPMGMARGMGIGGAGIGMGGGYGPYGGAMNQPMGVGMNQPMGMGMGVNVGMSMGMGMNQGMPMRPPTGMPPGGMPGVGYNPMGTGYGSQQPYGGYR